MVQTFAFNGINSVNTYVLNAGDFIRISVTANTTGLCLVNEYHSLGGTDADASRGVFQTSVNLGDVAPGVTHVVTFEVSDKHCVQEHYRHSQKHFFGPV